MLIDKIIDVFVKVGDFANSFDQYIKKYRISDSYHVTRNKKASLSDDELKNICKLQHTTHRY